MTEKKRIFLNVIASHGRSLFVLVCGFLTSRWALGALGHEAFGLLGLIGGMMVIVALANTTLSHAICRFFAFVIGKHKSGECSPEESREWFSLAVLIHACLAFGLVGIGYPIVTWLVRHYLTIPNGMVDQCIVVLRWVCVTSFVGTLAVPFRAMYTAKQEIAELTLYSFVQTTLYTGALCYMYYHAGDWLVWVAAWLCFQNSFLNAAIILRASFAFPECRLRFKNALQKERVKRLLTFSFWEFFGSLGFSIRNEGSGILVNKALGPAMNASFSVALSLAGRAQTFANEVDGAFAPAIVTAYGAGDLKGARSLALACCKYSSCLVLLIVLPLSMAIDDFLQLWLKNPPADTACVCVLICIAFSLMKLETGIHHLILAKGKNRGLQLLSFGCYLLTLPIAGLGLFFGLGMASMGLGFVGSIFFLVLGKILLAQSKGLIDIRDWLMHVVMPVVIAAAISAFVALPIRVTISNGIVRLFATAIAVGSVFIGLGFTFVLTRAEREIVMAGLMKIIRRAGFRRSA